MNLAKLTKGIIKGNINFFYNIRNEFKDNFKPLDLNVHGDKLRKLEHLILGYHGEIKDGVYRVEQNIKGIYKAFEDLILSYSPESDLSLIRGALDVSEGFSTHIYEKYKQTRLISRNDPVLKHDLSAMVNLIKFFSPGKGFEYLLAAEAMHDLKEDCEGTDVAFSPQALRLMLQNYNPSAKNQDNFEKDLEKLIFTLEGVTDLKTELRNGNIKKDSHDYKQEREKKEYETLIKFFKHLQLNPYLILAKAPERMHNMETRHGLNKERREKMTIETYFVYLPLLDFNEEAYNHLKKLCMDSAEELNIDFDNISLPERYKKVMKLVYKAKKEFNEGKLIHNKEIRIPQLVTT